MKFLTGGAEETAFDESIPKQLGRWPGLLVYLEPLGMEDS